MKIKTKKQDKTEEIKGIFKDFLSDINEIKNQQLELQKCISERERIQKIQEIREKLK